MKLKEIKAKMPINKLWMQKSRVSQEYDNGVLEFLDIAFINAPGSDKLPCPCVRCNKCLMQNRHVMHNHLQNHGIVRNYVRWVMHGEYEFNESTYDDEFEDSPHDDMHGLLHDAFQMPKTSNVLEENEISLIETGLEEPNDEATKFYSFLKDAEKELYPGCTKFTKLAFVIRLIHIKCLNGWSNKSFTMLLELLKEVLPECDNFPGNFYEAKKNTP